MSKLLIDDRPLQVLPSLAEKIGLNEAVLTQQIHYWLQKKENLRDGRYWVYGSYPYWEKQFPFWSRITIKRTFTSLENANILITANYNKAGFDKTKWYTINYDQLKSIEEGMSQRWDQIDPTIGSNRSHGMDQIEQTNTLDISKTSSEISKKDIVVEVINHLNASAGTHYKSTTKKTKTLIHARLAEGFKQEDFMQVIDKKCKQWKKDKKMNRYLRPETLFGTKFEGYLNERGTTDEPNHGFTRKSTVLDF
ncbi:conserved phage C-terminal domain-containing protein [Sporolactobacillus terrae]|uniref:conserved phage C-terminal domain-containing protein n=1 Tax=Sporolactobacillus terrae TaxID=269673 RepID=UPI00048C461C|nr:conserved phage C-terminal domain-containing protein [Sporolactobacillus terrae]